MTGLGRRLENNIKTNLIKTRFDSEGWIHWEQSCEWGKEPLDCIKMQEIARLTEDLLASQERLGACSQMFYINPGSTDHTQSSK